jgi:signal transduction histidine kinase
MDSRLPGGLPWLVCWGVCAALVILSPASSTAQDELDTHKRVLVLNSFGRDFASFEDVATNFETELMRLSPQPVEFFEASLETARFVEGTHEGPLVGYLDSLLSEEGVDLLVPIGGPAVRFFMRQRELLAPSTPLLAAGLERRVAKLPQDGNTIAVPFVLDLPGVIENILQALPDTKEIVVVLGGSPLSQGWFAETERDFSPFSDRVHFTWTYRWTLPDIEKHLAGLPPHSAIFFGELTTDGAGMPYPGYTALERIHEAANAPIFGAFETQLGRGIVGGLLLSEAEMGRRAASAAIRILNGEAPGTIEEPPVTAASPAYDFRELERWGISEKQLPAGSQILFRPPSIWERYRTPLLIGLGILALQSVLIGGLLVQSSRRRMAQEEAGALARRLLTAHEDERRRLARELHDDLSQRLARLVIDAASVEQLLPATREENAARAMRNDLMRLSEDVHALSYQLHPSVLDDLGLQEALKVECDRFSRRESIPASLSSFAAPKGLAIEISTCLFRVAQEALRNAARHSHAKSVSLEVASVNGTVQMTVTDDGVGFDTAQSRARRSLGHASMRERTTLVHGKVEIESQPGRGTCVRVSVPVKGGSQ